VWGKDKYEYQGQIEFDGRQARLLANLEPQAMVKCGGRYYLLMRRYFARYDFQWFQLSDSTAFRPLSTADIPRELWLVRLKDPRETYWLRVGVLADLAKTSAAESVRCYFDALYAVDPHFAFDDNWQDSMGRALDLQEFAAEIPQAENRNEYWPIVTRILDSARPSDDPAVIAQLLSALKRLDPAEAESKICEFRNKWTREAHATDWRLDPLIHDEYFRRIDCEAPQRKLTSTQSSSPKN